MASSSAGATRRPSGPQLLSIGQVLARLTPDFPDLTPSKLRFLEEQGLVHPSRTASGYRKFSPGDVERVRTILSLQRDHYLPLKVIRAHLDEVDAGRATALPSSNGRSIFDRAQRYSREELLAATGATPGLLTEAVSLGLIAPGEHYGEDAVVLVDALVALARAGIEPRHLRGVRASVEREVALLESALAPRLRPGDGTSRARLAETARELSARLDLVRSALRRSALQRLEP